MLLGRSVGVKSKATGLKPDPPQAEELPGTGWLFPVKVHRSSRSINERFFETLVSFHYPVVKVFVLAVRFQPSGISAPPDHLNP